MAMTNVRITWLLIGFAIICSTSLIHSEQTLFIMLLFISGWVAILWSLLKEGLLQAEKMLWLLAISNVGFWSSFFLGQIWGRASLNPLKPGIQLSDVLVGLWLIVFIILSFVEGIVLIRRYSPEKRAICWLGIGGVLFQIFVSLYAIYRWIEAS